MPECWSNDRHQEALKNIGKGSESCFFKSWSSHTSISNVTRISVDFMRRIAHGSLCPIFPLGFSILLPVSNTNCIFLDLQSASTNEDSGLAERESWPYESVDIVACGVVNLRLVNACSYFFRERPSWDA